MTRQPSTVNHQVFSVHSWLKQVHLCYLPGPESGKLAIQAVNGILDEFRHQGHVVQEKPDQNTDILLNQAVYGEAISWRKSLGLTARKLYNLEKSPTVFALIQIHPSELERVLSHFHQALAKEPADAKDFDFPGLAPSAYRVLYEQGRRGGPILALERLLQAQAKCLNILLLAGSDQIEGIYHFDLVGAHPFSQGKDLQGFYRDVVLRMVTRVSTHEVTAHLSDGNPIPYRTWKALDAPRAMSYAARELDRRAFFTEMVRIEDLVHVPVVSDAVASQYSEGCFSTWDAELGALISTITGSARPVNKGEITDDDLAVITGVRPDHQGTLVREVEGKTNFPPSSEAVEMMDVVLSLPKIEVAASQQAARMVPVVRSILHGHRGIAAYDPEHVEFVPLDSPYYHYPVTCATEAQANGIHSAFARSQALNNPADSRQVAFTILPTHGVVLAEKWVTGKMPFQVIWEFFDQGQLELQSHVPQTLVEFIPQGDKMVLKTAG